MTEPLLGADEIKELLELGTATVYEASGLDCALDAGIHAMWRGAKVCGPAYTVRCHPADNLAIHRALEYVGPGQVLVVQAGGQVGGYWGEILTTAAEARGVAGLVIDGGLRDLDAIERHGFPAFARGTGVFRTGKHVPGDLDVPLVVGGVLVEPGAIILADADGVLAVPRAALERTLATSRQREARERGYMERLKSGELTLDIYGFPR